MLTPGGHSSVFLCGRLRRDLQLGKHKRNSLASAASGRTLSPLEPVCYAALCARLRTAASGLTTGKAQAKQPRISGERPDRVAARAGVLCGLVRPLSGAAVGRPAAARQWPGT